MGGWEWGSTTLPSRYCTRLPYTAASSLCSTAGRAMQLECLKLSPRPAPIGSNSKCSWGISTTASPNSIATSSSPSRNNSSVLPQLNAGNNYDLFNNNCNHFALAMAQRLGLAHNHPHTYIFRLTNCLNTLRCCIPECVLSGRLDWFRSSDKENEELQ